jgi:hypothetical protein
VFFHIGISFLPEEKKPVQTKNIMIYCYSKPNPWS